MGLNEFAGYFAVAGSALATGYIAAHYGLRPEPFYLGVVFVAVGLLLSALLVRETIASRGARVEAARRACRRATLPSQREIFWRTTLTDRNLSSVSQAGLVNNLNDGMAWGLFPLFFVAAGMNLAADRHAGGDLPGDLGHRRSSFTGAWSDRVGRKWLIASGMWVQALGIASRGPGGRLRRASQSGPRCSASARRWSIRRCSPPSATSLIPRWRASSVGVYRLWRDLGYAIGALLAGITADALGLPAAMWVVAALTFASGVVVALRMTETAQADGAYTMSKDAASYL